MRAIVVDRSGATPTVRLAADVPVPKLRADHVLIKVFYTALNRADLLQRNGGYNAPAGESQILGLEATGVIVALGPDCGKVTEYVCSVCASTQILHERTWHFRAFYPSLSEIHE